MKKLAAPGRKASGAKKTSNFQSDESMEEVVVQPQQQVEEREEAAAVAPSAPAPAPEPEPVQEAEAEPTEEEIQQQQLLLQQRKAAKAAARAQAAAEAEAEERRRAEAAERYRIQQEEEDRLMEEAFQKDKQRLENLRREEELRLQREREEEAERVRQERARREEESRRLAAEKANEESSQLAEKRRLLEEKRRERAKFLNSVDNFNTDLETKVADENRKKTETTDVEADRITEQMKAMSANFKSNSNTGFETAQPAPRERAAPVAAAAAAPAPAPLAKAPSRVDESDAYSIQLDAGNRNKNSSAANSLFKSNGNEDVYNRALYSNEDIFGNARSESTYNNSASDELSAPSAIGAKAKPKSSKSAAPAPVPAPASSQPVASAPPAAPVAAASNSNNSNKAPYKPVVNYDYDDEEVEGGATDDKEVNISNFLTSQERRELNENQKAAWRALQADMSSKRKDFHGAVTYAWEGIFSWQMYGSAEAVDESGKTYTEYLMRCQWGTTWENMQPWIVARRYREFDQLDLDLKAKFPELAPRFRKLSEKSFFNFLDATVIAARRISMEEYMCHIVATMPTILRSGIMDEFLGISVRIRTIRGQMEKAGTWVQGGITSKYLAPGGERNLGSSDLSEDPKFVTATTVVADGSIIEIKDIIITSPEHADRVRLEKKVQPMDSDLLGVFEENVRELWLILCRSGTREVGKRSRSRALVLSLTNRWPALRATMDLTNPNMDLTLIPRVMQVEEDFMRCYREFRLLLSANQMK